MNAFEYAINMESSIHDFLLQLAKTADAHAQPFLMRLAADQQILYALLITANGIDPAAGAYPDLSANEKLTDDKAWKEAAGQLYKTAQPQENMLLLWTASAFVEKSSQFYDQAVANSAYATMKLFFSSLSQFKKMQRRKLHTMLRYFNNDAWSKLGFAPFDFT